MKHKIIGFYSFTIPPDTAAVAAAAAPSLCRRLSPPDTLVPGVQHLEGRHYCGGDFAGKVWGKFGENPWENQQNMGKPMGKAIFCWKIDDQP